ncbi:hypothetical protein GW931_03160 [archaeon]|nr:hypothetical protein [archaeon]
MRRPENKNQLAEYFKKNLAKNYTEDSLIFALQNQGYSRTAVEQALIEAHKEIAKTAPVLKEKPIIKYELFDEKNNPIKVEPFTKWEKVKFFLKGKKI